MGIMRNYENECAASLNVRCCANIKRTIVKTDPSNPVSRILAALLIGALALAACAQVPGPVASQPTAPAAESPGTPAPLLPHTFYYLAFDEAGLRQVFRLERDGTSRRQVTTEPAGVRDYDVSPTDGREAVVTNDYQLVLLAADGSVWSNPGPRSAARFSLRMGSHWPSARTA